MCQQFPDLVVLLLDAAHLDAAQELTGSRLPRAAVPVCRTRRSFDGVDWSDEFPMLISNGNGGDSAAATGPPFAHPDLGHVEGAAHVEVTARVAGMCGLLALDGPFNAIAQTRASGFLRPG